MTMKINSIVVDEIAFLTPIDAYTHPPSHAEIYSKLTFQRLEMSNSLWWAHRFICRKHTIGARWIGFWHDTKSVWHSSKEENIYYFLYIFSTTHESTDRQLNCLQCEMYACVKRNRKWYENSNTNDK